MAIKGEKITAGIYIIVLIIGFSGLFVLAIMKAYDLTVLNLQELFSHPKFMTILWSIFIVIGIPTLIILGKQINNYINNRDIHIIWKGVGVILAIVFSTIGLSFYAIAIPNFPYVDYDSKPYLTWANQQDPTDSITVCWRSRTITKSVVYYGTSPSNLDKIAFSYETSKNHHVKIMNLNPDTIYYYGIDGYMVGKIWQFKTAPIGATNITFTVWSDPRTNEFATTALTRPNVVKYMYQDIQNQGKKLDFSICTGDIAWASFDPVTWKIWLEDVTYKDWASNQSNIVSVGNHERIMDTRALEFRKYYPYESLSYSFDYGQIHVIVLDTWKDSYTWFSNISDILLYWIEEDLKTSTDADFTILATHPAPIYLGDTNGSWFNGELFDGIQSLADKYGIDAVFHGHRHHYELNKINQTYYMNLGIGGSLNTQEFENYTKQPYTIDIETGGTGYCMVDVNSTHMVLNPRWINGTSLGKYIIPA